MLLTDVMRRPYSMWRKINKLAEFVLPQSDGVDGYRFAGRLVNVTLGNYLTDELCAMTSLTITPNEDMMWEIEDPEIHHPSITLTPSVGEQIADVARRKINDARKKKLDAMPEGENKLKLESKIKTFPLTAKQRRDLDAKGEGTGYARYVMPRVCTISVGLKVLHNRVPGADDSSSNGLFIVNKTPGNTSPGA